MPSSKPNLALHWRIIAIEGKDTFDSIFSSLTAWHQAYDVVQLYMSVEAELRGLSLPVSCVDDGWLVAMQGVY